MNNLRTATMKGTFDGQGTLRFMDSRSKKMQGIIHKMKKTQNRLKLSSELTTEVTPVSVKETEEEKLQRFDKDIRSALQYYKVILEKGFLQKLPGTATVVLECIISIEDIINKYMHYSAIQDENVEDLLPLRESLHRNVTSLIRLSDDVLFDSSANCQPDKSAALRAVNKVVDSLNQLIKVVSPRLRKQKLNAEFLHFCRSNSTHSSANSLDDSNVGIRDGETSEFSSNTLTHKRKNSAPTPDRLCVVTNNHERDSGIASELSDATISNFASQTSIDSSNFIRGRASLPPAKPPLPDTSNRSFYGNQPFPGLNIRKASSHPGKINSNGQVSPVPMKVRPSSDFRTTTANREQFLEPGNVSVSSSTSASRSSLDSSRSSSLSSSGSTGISASPTSRDSFFSKDARQSTASKHSNDSLDLDEVGMSAETRTKIQLYSKHYESLATSSLSLFSEDGDRDSIFSPSSPQPDTPSGKPSIPYKARNTKALINYFNFVSVDKYSNSTNGERPASFYDNLPQLSVYQHIDNEQLKEFAAETEHEAPPKLPPKKGKYNRSISDDSSNSSGGSPRLRLKNTSPRNSRINRAKSTRRSERDSNAIYEEDNVPALDSVDVSRFLIFKEDGNNGPLLYGGTVDGLIVYAADSKEKNPLFYAAFVATYRTFISPQNLICKLLYRSNRFRDKPDSLHISQGALSLLIMIVDGMYEELDKSLFDQLRAEVHRLLNLGELKLSKQLRDKIVNYCLKLQSNLLPKPHLDLPKQNSVTIFEFRTLDLAQQMTLLDADYFVKIGLPEILAWGKEQSGSMSPNLADFIEHFNNMSYWCRTLILKEVKQQDRERLFKKFLKIMRHCRRMNNFSSYLAILSALDSSPLRRLEWPKNLTESLEECCQLIDSASAFKSYRQALSEAKPPCIPYLGLILQDITFIHLGNPSELPDGKINFVKRWQQFNVLDTVRRFKESLYDFPRNEKILEFFNEYEDHMDEEDMWDKSQEIQPRKKK